MIENVDLNDTVIDTPVSNKLSLKKKILIGVLLLFLIVLSVFLYARFIGTSGIYVKEYSIYNDKIKNSFDGFKIVHISDIHYGSVVDKNFLNNLVKKANELKPDIIVITGDLIDKDFEMTSDDEVILKEFLDELNALYGKYIIGGNHDYKFKQFSTIIEASSFMYLNNTYDTIYKAHDESIFIAGIESFNQKKNDIDKALNVLNNVTTLDEDGNEIVVENFNNQNYKILLIHEPDYIDKVLEKYDVDLVLAGHSHNGQVRLPVIGPFTTPIGSKKYYLPYYNVDDTDLYISSGVGTSTLPLRLFNRPTFNFYRINKRPN